MKRKQLKNSSEHDGSYEDDELEAEMNAVLAAKHEKFVASNNSSGLDTAVEKNVNRRDALLKAVEDTANQLPFLETQLVCVTKLHIVDDNDDLNREMAFYNHTIEAVMKGRKQLEKLGVPIRRPTDYFCENVKSDEHMARIKDRLLLEERKIEAFELRKNREQNRKYNKQLTDLQKQKQSKLKATAVADAGREFSDKDTNAAKSSTEKHLKSKKRIAMDRKYGLGGREAIAAKKNDKRSLDDFTDFNPRGGKFVRREGGSRAGGAQSRGRGSSGIHSSSAGKAGRRGAKPSGGKKETKRPGKSVRQKNRKH